VIMNEIYVVLGVFNVLNCKNNSGFVHVFFFVI
jgi:hypothetical protein